MRHEGLYQAHIVEVANCDILPQYDRAASIEPDDVERILANIDAHRGNGRD
jgi:hypothetical protein